VSPSNSWANGNSTRHLCRASAGKRWHETWAKLLITVDYCT
jgi:hypothetical protein